jgi:formate hydrogenlyase transcriptional activator
MKNSKQEDLYEKITGQSIIAREERFRAIYHGLSLPTFVWRSVNDDFKLVDWNHAFEKLMKGNIYRHKGMTASRFFRERQDILADMRRCLDNRTTIRIEKSWVFTDRKEERHFNAKVTFIQPDQVLIHLEDITKRQRASKALKDRLKFHELISGISASLINLPINEIDRAIEDILALITQVFDIEHAHVSEYLSSIERWQERYISFSKNYPGKNHPDKGGYFLIERSVPYKFKSFTALMRRGEFGIFNSIDDVPDEMEESKTFWLAVGIKSTLAIPLNVANEFFGAILIHSYRKKREWTLLELNRLKFIGTIIVNTLMRKRAVDELDEQMRFERLVSDLSAKFVGLPASLVDKEVENSLHLINDFIHADSCIIWRLEKDRQVIHAKHSFYNQDIGPPTDSLIDVKLPWTIKKLLNREMVIVNRMDEIPEEAKPEKDYFSQVGHKSVLFIPLFDGESIVGAISFGTLQRERTWPKALVKRLQLVGEVFVNAIMRKRSEMLLRESNIEINRLKEHLEMENIYLREEIEVKNRFENIIGKSSAIKKVLQQVEKVALTDSTVLLLGETGTGKDLIASAIHNLSLRKKRPMIKVNLAALPPTLMESEMFGHEKGAYTGAVDKHAGRFEVANGSTLFLDEIGELSPSLQAKLLRALQEGQIERIGSSKTIHVDVRIIAATNRNLSQEIRDGKFREDLYYRLNVFPIFLPPLRERRDDIPLLTREIVKDISNTMGKHIETIPKKSMTLLKNYSWPGNIRELRNVLERAVIISFDDVLRVQLPEISSTDEGRDSSFDEMAKKHIRDALKRTNGRIKGKNGAAEILGLKPSTLYGKLTKLGIQRTGHGSK